MKDLNEELWSLGIQAKTEHNEVAPSQHELANIYMTINVSVDQNNLTMEIMKKTARKHGLECLLHEKPFAGVNGSGKHNNWSLKTDEGVNLLEPGETPSENAQFLIFLCAVIKAVDEYQDLIRISVASAGNDHRLGASEAPPAIVSIFLGDELAQIINDIENDTIHSDIKKEPFHFTVHTLPAFPKDNTDRNRTSPFAFTGNKFEFRMPGSSASIATPNTILNTVIAEELRYFADVLENAEEHDQAIQKLIKETIRDHKRIIFNGNGYDESWIKEAQARGLSNLASTPDALAHYLDEKNLKVFIDNGVLTEAECRSRYEIYLEKYYKTINIEAKTLLDMIKKDILPAVLKYENTLSDALIKEEKLNLIRTDSYSRKTLVRVNELLNDITGNVDVLEDKLRGVSTGDPLKTAYYYRDEVLPLMEEIRHNADELETLTDRTMWPIPTYRELLFGVD
ncbi:MAG: glutamine synthetase type III, partial [Erysipelotrichaceae bacterium]|nr:glutamine synthetase type III [Erysipelotrichaceae bacterium]